MINSLTILSHAQDDGRDSEIYALDVFNVNSDSDDGYLATETVSGSRFREDITKIPQTIQTVNEQFMDDFNVNGLEDALLYVTGIQFGGTQGSFNIRGFSGTLLTDGVRSSEFNSTYNSERVEVLKGPSSVYYGAMQPGGVVNNILKRPTAETIKEINFEFGQSSYLHVTGDFGGALNSEGTLLYRFNFLKEDSEQDLDNSDRDVLGISPSLTWIASESLNFTLSVDILEQDNPSTEAVPFLGGGVRESLFGILPRTWNLGEAIIRDEDRTLYSFETSFTPSSNVNIKNTFRYVERDVHTYDHNTFSFLFPFNGFKYRGRLRSGMSESRNYYNQLQAEIRHSGDNWSNRLLLGLDISQTDDSSFSGQTGFADSSVDIFDRSVYDTTGDPKDLIYVAPDFSNLVFPAFDSLARNQSDIREEADEFGIYLMNQIKLFDEKLVIVGGARYDDIEVDSLDRATSTLTALEFDSVSPSFGIVFEALPNLSFYASHSESFDTAGAQAINTDTGEPFEPIEGESTEIGAKFSFADRRVVGTIAFFDSENIGEPQRNPVTNLLEQSAGNVNEGYEIDLAVRILPNWQSRLAYTYQDAQRGPDLVNPGLTGTPLNTVPENTWSFTNLITFDDGPLSGLRLSGAIIATDETFGFGSAIFPIDDWWRADVNASYSWELDNGTEVTAGLNIHNLTDEHYLLGGAKQADSTRVRGSLRFRF